MSSMIESVLHETGVFPPSAEFVRQANVSGMQAYRKLVAEAERDFEGFWARLAKEQLLWHKPFSKVLDESNAPFFKWFYDGELNASYNCLDRHLKTQPDKTAIIFEADDGKVTRITCKALYHEVCKLANALRAHGVKTGDRVLIYMPMSIQVVVGLRQGAQRHRVPAHRLERADAGADRQAQGHPIRRQPAQDALGQDHAPAAALDRQQRGDQAGRLYVRESGDPRAAQAKHLSRR